MRMRNKLMTTILCSGLAAGWGATGVAFAQQSSVLQPNSGWTSTLISASQSGNEPYCALARRFTNNTVLTMARNSREETSIAIDFQKTNFSNIRDYQVRLTPGEGQDRAFKIRPVSNKALVVRLGRDQPFFDALQNTGQLGIEIENERYSFNMGDIFDGQMKMNECILNIIEPAAGTPNIMPPRQVEAPTQLIPAVAQAAKPSSGAVVAEAGPVVSIPAVARAEQAGRISTRAIDAAPAEPQMLYRAVADNETAAAPAAAQSAVQIQPAPDHSRALAENERQLRSMKEENIRLRNALERERRSYEERLMQEGQNSSLVAELNEKMQMLRIENEDLRHRLAKLPSSQPQVVADIPIPACPAPTTLVPPELQGELNMLREENQRLQQALTAQAQQYAALENQLNTPSGADAESLSEAAQLQQRIMSLQAENAGLKEALAAVEGGAAGSVSLSQLRSVEAHLRAVEQDRDKLLREIDALRSGEAGERIRISSDNWNLEQATRRFNEAEREVQRLGRLVEEQRAACSREKKALEYMLFDPNIASEEQISRLITLEERVAQTDAALKSQKTGYEGRIAALQKELTVKSDLASNAQIRAAALENQIEEQRVAGTNSARAELDAVRRDAQRLVAQVSTLEQELLDAESAARIAQGEKQVLNQRMAAMESELQAIRTVHAETPSVAQFELVKAENTDLARQKDELARQKDEMARQLAMLEDQMQRTRADIDTHHAQAATAVSEKERLAQQVASLESELEHFQSRARLNPSPAQYNALRDEKMTVAQRVAILNEELNRARSAQDQQEAESRKMARENQALNEKVATLENQMQQLRMSANQLPRPADLQAAQSEKEQLRQQVAALRAELAQSRTNEGVNIAAATSSVAARAEKQELAARVAVLENALQQAKVQPKSVQPQQLAGIEVAAGTSNQPVRSGRSDGAIEVERLNGSPSFDQSRRPVSELHQSAATPAIISPPPPRASKGGGVNAGMIEGVLSQANIMISEAVRPVAVAGGGTSVQAYSWETGGLFGSSESRPMAGRDGFDALARGYLQKTEQRCQGDFAAVQVTAEQSGDLQVSAYEVACIGQQGSASVAVVFYARDGQFTAIAHEASLEDMDLAMDARDRLLSILLQTRLAAR